VAAFQRSLTVWLELGAALVVLGLSVVRAAASQFGIYPEFRIWVKGSPRSKGGDRKRARIYVQRVGAAARAVFPAPLQSSKIEVLIVFAHAGAKRPDLDNVGKLVQDTLKGIVYLDDDQVCALRVDAVALDEPCATLWGVTNETLVRILRVEEFLIRMRIQPPGQIARQLPSS
jgi:Endodeoxyribonuclease RusA